MQIFGVGLRPVQLFVNTTIMFPPAKVGIPFSYLVFLGWHFADFSLPCCFSSTGLWEVFTPICCSVSRHDALPLPTPRNGFRFFGSLYCYVLGKGRWEQGNPGRGKGWDGEIGVLGVKLVIMNLLRFLGFGCLESPDSF